MTRKNKDHLPFPRPGARWPWAAIALLSVAVAACDGGLPRQDPNAPHQVADPEATSSALAPGEVCTESDTHLTHLMTGLNCETCHPCGNKFGFTNVFTYPRGTTTLGGTLTKGAPTVCSVGCHYPLGGAPHSVTWGTGPLACVACHSLTTLPANHPTFSGQTPTREDCQRCHNQGNHTSGTVTLMGHDAAWIDPLSSTFHALSANRDLGTCRVCHGQNLDGGAAQVACASCHDRNLPAGVTSWRTNCVMCHGGTDNTTGAPPKATFGNGGDAIRTGAHTTHVAGTALTPPIACGVCHTRPADALTAGHIDGSPAEVRFSGQATQGLASVAPWDRTTATCANYCHGATLRGGSNKTPLWTAVGQGETACGACHGVPPPSPHPNVGSSPTVCSGCHAETVDPTGQVIAPSAGGKHMDGILEATGGHDLSWTDPSSPDFHAFTAVQSLDGCTGCHGAALDGVGGMTTVACADCHDNNLPAGVTSWRTNCVMCHGGINNMTGAPPRGIWSHPNDQAKIGAHTVHVAGSSLATGFACEVCHVRPAEAMSPGHIDGSTTMIRFGTFASQSNANPTWNPEQISCANTYCHGGYTGSFTFFFFEDELTALYSGKHATPRWTDGPMACDSCHGNPPSENPAWHGRHPYGNECAQCHPDVSGANAVGTAITDRMMHVNGVVDVQPKWRSACFRCH